MISARSLRYGVAIMSALLFACSRAEEVVQDPVPMPDPSPIEYPLVLWDRKVQGETEVLIHVNERGNVDSVLVSKRSGFFEFDSAALAGARRLRFTPGRRGDRPIAMWTKIPVRFTHDSTALLGAPTGSGISHE